MARLPVDDPHRMLTAFAELAVQGIGPALGAGTGPQPLGRLPSQVVLVGEPTILPVAASNTDTWAASKPGT